MNYFIIEDIEDPISKYCIIQTTMSRSDLDDLIDEAKERAEENGTYDMEELETLIGKDKNTLIIYDFDTLYV